MNYQTIKKAALFTILSIASMLTLAAVGGKNRKAKATNSASVRMSTHNFSLRSGYTFKSGKLLQLSTTPTQYVNLTGFVPIKNGNKTTFVATKHVITPASKVAVTNNYGHFDFKVKLSLN